MRYSSSPLDFVARFFETHRIISRLLVLLLLCTGLVICWNAGKAYEKSGSSKYISVPVAEGDFDETFPYLSVTELDSVTAPENATELRLDDFGSEVYLNSGGDYILSGSLNGHILIDAKEQNVHLFLNGVSITSAGGPAILLPDNSGEKLVITLVDGTDNTISDNGDFRDYDEYEGAIEASCDITINGTGTLAVNGYYKDAIRSKDIVKILDGNYTLKCKRNGIMGNDGVLVSAGNITISSEKNGIKTSKKGEDGRGNLIISGGDLSIIAGRYAFVTVKANIYIYNCTIYNRSIVDTYDCGGLKRIQEGCVQ
jgi:hypothetical protein